MAFLSRIRADEHDYHLCEDEDCPRFPCRIYKEGWRDGYEAGEAAGAAGGYAAGYSAGQADGAAAASSTSG